MSERAAGGAEGCGRGGGAELGRPLQIAVGSASAWEDHLLVARDLGRLEEARHAALEAELLGSRKTSNAFIHKVRSPREPRTTENLGTSANDQ